MDYINEMKQSSPKHLLPTAIQLIITYYLRIGYCSHKDRILVNQKIHQEFECRHIL